jgi:hypothetical protein
MLSARWSWSYASKSPECLEKLISGYNYSDSFCIRSWLTQRVSDRQPRPDDLQSGAITPTPRAAHLTCLDFLGPYESGRMAAVGRTRQLSSFGSGHSTRVPRSPFGQCTTVRLGRTADDRRSQLLVPLGQLQPSATGNSKPIPAAQPACRFPSQPAHLCLSVCMGPRGRAIPCRQCEERGQAGLGLLMRSTMSLGMKLTNSVASASTNST